MVDRSLQPCARCGAVGCRCSGRHRLPGRIQALDCTKCSIRKVTSATGTSGALEQMSGANEEGSSNQERLTPQRRATLTVLRAFARVVANARHINETEP